MWFESRGGGTPNPMIWVHAGPSGAHPMGFHVSQEVWDYVIEHGLNLVYDRSSIQSQLNRITALLDGSSVQDAVAAVQEAGTRIPLRRHSRSRYGWVIGLVGLAAIGAWASRTRGTPGVGD